MSGVFTTSGASIAIGQTMDAKATDFVSADFDINSWVTISWAENIGKFGDESQEVTFDAISEGRTQKIKGQKNAGTMQCIFGVDTTDEGQSLARYAESQIYDYGWRVQFNDMPAGGTAPSTRYFIGKVMSASEQLDTANNVVKLNVNIGVNSNIVYVDAY